MNIFSKKKKGLPENPNIDVKFDQEHLREIYLAGGCFWGLEAYMCRIYGVYDAISGYANGHTENPKYEDLIYKNSGHAETVKVIYDYRELSLKTLLAYYFRVIDPISLNQQGNDRGVQYRTGIYYTNEKDLADIQSAMTLEQQNYQVPLVVEVLPLIHFYKAEEYHQKYLEKNQGGYCHIDLFEVEDVIIEPSRYPMPPKETLTQILTMEQYEVTQNNGTERPFQNNYWNHMERGLYVDVITGEPLFSSRDKFESSCGWPSFSKPIAKDVVKFLDDNSHFMQRIEVRARVSNAHLGHVFNDGPQETGGLRFCINSASLKFIPYSEMVSQGYGYLRHTTK